MTTKVTIFNHGPDPVTVKTVQTHRCDRVVCDLASNFLGPLQPGQARDYYVHVEQDLLIEELRDKG